MGYCPDWLRQDMKKTGKSGPTTEPSRKDMGSLFHSSPAPQSKSVAKPLRLADGDTEATYKARGLELSKNDNVGFFERLRMGNIDQEGSEAYNRFGAGRAKAEDSERMREESRLARQAEANRTELTTGDFGRDDKDTTPVPMPMSRDEFVRSEKDTTPVAMPTRRATASGGAPARPARDPDFGRARSTNSAPRPTSPVRSAGPTAGEARDRRAQERATSYDRNRPETRPSDGRTMAQRQAQYQADMNNIPLMRGARAVADAVMTPRGPNTSFRAPDDMPSPYASKEEWAAYRARQAAQK